MVEVQPALPLHHHPRHHPSHQVLLSFGMIMTFMPLIDVQLLGWLVMAV